MGIVERREREREEVRRKILDAARELFMAEGYERVTMRRIADAIEYSPTTIYNHFKDKDDLVNALCHEEFSQLLGALDLAGARRRSRAVDPPDRRRVRGLRPRQPNHYRFMFMTSIRGGPRGQRAGAAVVRAPAHRGRARDQDRRVREGQRRHHRAGAVGEHPRGGRAAHHLPGRTSSPARPRRPTSSTRSSTTACAAS